MNDDDETHLEIPRWVEPGMAVLIPCGEARVLGVVSTAAGYSARVKCDSPEIDRWYHLDELRLPTRH